MIQTTIKKGFKLLWSLFMNGLLTILPVAITVGVVSFCLSLLKTLFAPLQSFKNSIPYLNQIPHAEFIIGIGLIFAAGIFLKSFVIRYMFELFESIVTHVPLVRLVYRSVKQLVGAFSPDDTHSFRQVVLVEFPRPGIYSIGFQTTKLSPDLAPDTDRQYYNVFLPTTPNPTTGYFLIVREGDFRAIDLTTQEAMALIISGGIVQPDRYKVN